MKKLSTRVFANFWNDQKGLVAVEWIGITAVVVIAAIIISGALMQGANGFAGSVVGQLNASSASVSGG